MSIIGDAYIAIRPDADGFEQETEREVSGAFGTVAKVGAAAAAATAAAVGAAAVKGVQQFATFEKGIQEVYTLLPGISEEAMGAMSDDVLQFSKDAGVLPDDVLPALYSSLSAGVPPDNVFAFMEQANMAALGGVTDLETAVDGISGVVNAYGADVIDAATASDVMFTTVRLGKTTFGELSSSLGDVTPLAGALGVSFEEVSAAMAASTAITGNTAKSTTGLKGLLAELGKEGTTAGNAFEQIAGQSFPDFIASGGDLAEALGMMADHADDTGGSLVDMFGSVEAGQSALQLTGSDAFVNNLAEMRDAAGATEAAYNTMDQGLSRSWDRIKAQAAVALVGIGEALAPMVQQLADLAEDVIPVVLAAVERLPAAISAVVAVVRTVVEWVQRWKVPLLAVAGIITASYIPALVRATVATVVNIARQTAAWVAARVAALRSVAAQVAAVGRLIARMAWMGVQAMIHAAKLAAAWVLGMGPIGWVIAGVVALAALIIANWDKISEWTGKAWGWVTDKVGQAWEWITSTISSAVESIKAWWSGLMDSARETWDGIVSAVSGAVDSIVEWVGNLRDRIVEGFRRIAEFVIEYHPLAIAYRLAREWVPRIVQAVVELVTRVVETVAGWVETVVAFVTDLWTRWVTIVHTIRDAVIEAVVGLVTSVVTTVAGWVETVIGFVTDLWTRWVALVHTIRDAVVNAVAALVARVVGNITRWVATVVQLVTNLWRRWVTLVHAIRDAVIDGIRQLVTRVVAIVSGWVRNVVRFVTNLRTDFVATIRNLVTDVVARIRELPGRILNIVRNFGDLLKGAGRRLIGGLISGIRDRIADIGSAIGDAASAVTRFWPFSPAREGPLRKRPMDKAGANIVKMLAQGITGETDVAVRAVEALARGVANVEPTITPQVRVAAQNGSQPVGAAGAARAAATQPQPMIGTMNVYTTDPRRAGDEVLRSLRERAYLSAPMGRQSVGR